MRSNTGSNAKHMYLAQFDIVKPKFPKCDERMNPFYESTRYVNDLAEKQPGFIWRETEENPELLEELWGSGYLYTLSIWRDVESLKNFLYRTPHKEFLKRGKEWFDVINKTKMVMWWIPEHTLPTLRDAHDRMTLLYEIGPSYQAFDLKNCDPPTTIF